MRSYICVYVYTYPCVNLFQHQCLQLLIKDTFVCYKPKFKPVVLKPGDKTKSTRILLQLNFDHFMQNINSTFRAGSFKLNVQQKHIDFSTFQPLDGTIG